MDGKIGVLALQGAFEKHHQVLESLNISSKDIRYPEDLDDCIGLILPGGESTTITKQLFEMGFIPKLHAFAQGSPIFGTCAGMILMSRTGALNLIDISVARNAYGRQCDSFSTHLQLHLPTAQTTRALFIRAPQITHIHSKEVRVLAENENIPVFVQQGIHLATSFHPELTKATEIHKYFIELCKKKQSPQPPYTTTPTKSFQTI